MQENSNKFESISLTGKMTPFSSVCDTYWYIMELGSNLKKRKEKGKEDMVYFKIMLLAIENYLLHRVTSLDIVPGLIHA